MSKRVLTPKQQALLEFVQSYYREYHFSPLIREVQTGCQIASYKSALDRLNALERKGLIKRAPNRHRGIALTRQALAPPPALAGVASPESPSALPTHSAEPHLAQAQPSYRLAVPAPSDSFRSDTPSESVE